MPLRVSLQLIAGLVFAAVLLSMPAALGGASAQTASDGTFPVVRLDAQLPFDDPVFLTHDGSDRVFIVEQWGMIWSAGLDFERSTPFLDIRDRVNSGSNEEGLLGLAFSPDFMDDRQIFVYYSAAFPRRTILSRFVVGNDGLPDTDSELVVLEVAQPFGNHNGGMIAFGPDGYLYVGLGDGGSRGDPQGNAQDRSTLLGSLLRIDVSESTEGERYRVPPDNPFVGMSGARGEIWAYGLRNPWRFSFDGDGETGDDRTGDLWLGDVGQNAYEEINLIVRGGNYGWNTLEGLHCYGADACIRGGFDLPIVEYGHDLGCSVTGGYVYRGDAIPELNGAYVYADFCSGRVWALRHDEGAVTGPEIIADVTFPISSFGVDRHDELYVLGFDGWVYRMRSQSPSPAPTATPTQPPPTATMMPTPTSMLVPADSPIDEGWSSGLTIALAVVAGGGLLGGLVWLRLRGKRS